MLDYFQYCIYYIAVFPIHPLRIPLYPLMRNSEGFVFVKYVLDQK